jgi:hypothetical protein
LPLSKNALYLHPAGEKGVKEKRGRRVNKIVLTTAGDKEIGGCQKINLVVLQRLLSSPPVGNSGALNTGFSGKK